MWTIVRFSLATTESHRYAEALELLARGGFAVRVVPSPPGGAGASVSCNGLEHGTAAGDVHVDTALVTRCVFTALQSGGFSPVMVSARHAALARAEEAAPPSLPAQAPFRSSNQR